MQLPVSWLHCTNANLACTCSAAAASNNTQACIQSEACRIHMAGVAELHASHMMECACKSPAVHDLKPGNMSDFSCLRLLRATCFLQPCGCLSCPRGAGGLRSCNINARVEVREYKSECGFHQRGTPRACFNDCDGGHETKPGLVCRKRRMMRGKSPSSQMTKAEQSGFGGWGARGVSLLLGIIKIQKRELPFLVIGT